MWKIQPVDIVIGEAMSCEQSTFSSATFWPLLFYSTDMTCREASNWIQIIISVFFSKITIHFLVLS